MPRLQYRRRVSRRSFNGFSLIEVVISSAIVASAIGAMFALASMSTKLTLLGQDRLIASQLSREGLEIVRQIRDQNFTYGACNTTSCPSWYTGILTESQAIGGSLPLAKQISTNVDSGFSLTDVTLNDSDRKCTDYVIRDISTGTMSAPLSTLPPNAETDPNQQIFCRRLFLEKVQLTQPVPALAESPIPADVGTVNAFRVRSQIAWLGYGRNIFKFNGLQAANKCSTGGTEWCLDETTILTNWRPAL